MLTRFIILLSNPKSAPKTKNKALNVGSPREAKVRQDSRESSNQLSNDGHMPRQLLSLLIHLDRCELNSPVVHLHIHEVSFKKALKPEIQFPSQLRLTLSRVFGEIRKGCIKLTRESCLACRMQNTVIIAFNQQGDNVFHQFQTKSFRGISR